MTMSAPSSASSPDNNVSLDAAHKRIAIAGWLVWPLLILFLPTFFMWLGYRLVSCTSDVSPVLCNWGFLVPLIPGGLIVGCLGFAVLTLHRRGRQTAFDAQVERQSRINPKRIAHYVRGGYRGLWETHKKHVQRTILFFSFGLSVLTGFWAFYFGLPALASMMLGVAILVVAFMFNDWIALGNSVRATLNEVLHKELSVLRPGLLHIDPANFKESTDPQRIANLREIYAGITMLGPKKLIADDAPDPDPQPLSALCLSGGGIRSATFNLGVIQALAKIGLLAKFDYLSSVSGGGYIASWLRTWIHREGAEAVMRALTNKGAPIDPLAPEPPPLENLRAYSNYLTPKLGLFSGDTWAAAAIIARNIIANWLVLIPVIAAVIGIPLLFLMIVQGETISEYVYPNLLCWALSIELAASLLVYACRRFAKRWLTSQAFFIACCVVPVCFAAGVLCTAALGLKLPWHDAAPQPSWVDLVNLWKFAFLWCVGVPLIGWAVVELFAAIFPSWAQSLPPKKPEPGSTEEKASEILAKASPPDAKTMRQRTRQPPQLCEFFALVISGSVGAALLVLAVRCWFSLFIAYPWLYVIGALPVVLGIYLLSRVLFVLLASLADGSNSDGLRGNSDDADREWWARLSGLVLLVIAVWAAGTGACLAGIYLPDWVQLHWHSSGKAALNTVKAAVAAVGTVTGLVASLSGSSAKTPANDNSRAPRPSINKMLLVQLAGAIFIVCVVILLSWGMRALSEWAITDVELFTTPRPWIVWLDFLVLLLFVAAIGVVASRVVNVNRFSLHGMYRNRLVRAYLGASNGLATHPRLVDPFTGFALNDNLPLRKFALDKDVRPLPIINATLNLVAGENLAWQQRKAESFSMTPYFCGSWPEGYRDSATYGGPAGITVGTAMTISGAAVNPNMGYNSSPVLAFIMSLFNVRLGAWLGNPNDNGDDSCGTTGPKMALMPLLAELFGLTNRHRRYVNLSDGGHFDNLGLYEAVLRRCRYVLVSDAGSDASFAFDDLGNAIRKIRIDFGIPIEFDDAIKILPTSSKKPGLYCAIATIRYSAVGEDPDGQLIYIKPTLRGRVPPAKQGDTVPYDVYSYSQGSDTFPHETTLDQWFTESQFESYRELGSYTVGRVGQFSKGASFKQFLASAKQCVEQAKASMRTEDVAVDAVKATPPPT